MSFFQRNRDQLVAQGIDPARVPPGQYVTDRFPVLHAGVVPEVDLSTWDFTVSGLVDADVTWTWDEFRSLPSERCHRRHSLRHEVVETRHPMGRGPCSLAVGAAERRRRMRTHVLVEA